MKKIDWKNELWQVLIAVLIITMAEVLLQKESYNFIEIFLSVLWKVLLISFIRIIFISSKN